MVIMPYLSQGTSDRKVIAKRMLSASVVASILLMVVYIGLCWIASRYSHEFSLARPEELLHLIAMRVLGAPGAALASFAVFLACITTAISLALVFSQYVKEEFKQKENLAIAVTILFSTVIANLGFSGIMQLWTPLLDVLYPVVILLCLFNLRKIKPLIVD